MKLLIGLGKLKSKPLWVLSILAGVTLLIVAGCFSTEKSVKPKDVVGFGSGPPQTIGQKIYQKIILMKNFLLLILLTTFVACEESPDVPKWVQTNKTFNERLTATSIGSTGLKIDLPFDIKLIPSIGPDFEVYYLVPKDSSKTLNYGGGLYLGNHPSLFPRTDSTCELAFIASPIFDSLANWDAAICDSFTSVQIIRATPSGIGWMEYAHAFGGASSDSNLMKVMKIFSTLEEKK